MRQQIGRTIQAGPLPRGHGLTEVLGVPVDDDCREQVEARHAVVLALGGAIPDFTLAPDAQGVFQGVVCLALVQPDLSPALHVGVEYPYLPRANVETTRAASYMALMSEAAE